MAEASEQRVALGIIDFDIAGNWGTFDPTPIQRRTLAPHVYSTISENIRRLEKLLRTELGIEVWIEDGIVSTGSLEIRAVLKTTLIACAAIGGAAFNGVANWDSFEQNLPVVVDRVESAVEKVAVVNQHIQNLVFQAFDDNDLDDYLRTRQIPVPKPRPSQGNGGRQPGR